MSRRDSLQGQPHRLALLLWLVLGLWPAALMAHGAGPRWQALLDASLELPADVEVQIRHSLAPQVLLSNQSEQALEVLDPRGRAFLRIGPEGVHADMNAAAWYNTYSVAGLATPQAAQDPQAAPRWRQVSTETAWGWFDPRLSPDPDAGNDSGADYTPPPWEIPTRRAEGSPFRLSGHFQQTQAQGQWQSQLTRSGRLSPQISIGLIPGPVDAFMLRNQSQQPVTVIGVDAEPFVRVGPEGVFANATSKTWRAWGRSRFEQSDLEATQPQWIKISNSQTYTWLDPRSRPATSEPSDASAAQALHHWSIPLRVAGELTQLPGQSQWQSAQPVTMTMASMDMRSSQGKAHAHQPIAAPKPWPRVQLKVESDSMSGWNVHVRTDNFRFSPETAGKQSQPGQGHAHLYVDGEKVARLYGPWFHLPYLSPGTHYIHATLNADDHSVWMADGRLIGHRIRVEVPQQAGAMSGNPATMMPHAAGAKQPSTHTMTDHVAGSEATAMAH